MMNCVDPRAGSAIKALSELISLVDKKADGEETMNRLMNEIGPIRSIYEAAYEELINNNGLSKQAAWAIDMIDGIARFSLRDECGINPSIHCMEEAGKYFSAIMFGRHIEYCYLMLLDAKGRMLSCPLMQKGTIDRSAVYARELAQAALRARAVYAILAHNHPGGTMEPSQADVQVTHAAKDALNAIRVIMLDHMIVSGHKFISIRKFGLPSEKIWLNQKKGDKLLEGWLKK